MTRNIYLVHESADLASSLQRALDSNKSITPFNAVNVFSTKRARDEAVVIAAGKDWSKALHILAEVQKNGEPFYAIISSPSMLRKTISQIEDPSQQSLAKEKTLTRKIQDQEKKEPCLDELIEKKLAHFVKKTRQSEGKNLYDLLIQEVEKPLIKLALRETEGNQVQASQLLGMHRNTLRKKIKDLNIGSAKQYAR
ncbi:hypothetical protein JYT87_03935 [Nitrospira defluvii]|nr:hypothetical protein [Nitrospira defluvii]